MLPNEREGSSFACEQLALQQVRAGLCHSLYTATVFSMAATCASQEEFRAFLSRRAFEGDAPVALDPNFVSADGHTIFGALIDRHLLDVPLLRQLVALGCSPTRRDGQQLTPLHRLCSRGSPGPPNSDVAHADSALLAELVEQGAGLAETTPGGDDALSLILEHRQGLRSKCVVVALVDEVLRGSRRRRRRGADTRPASEVPLPSSLSYVRQWLRSGWSACCGPSAMLARLLPADGKRWTERAADGKTSLELACTTPSAQSDRLFCEWHEAQCVLQGKGIRCARREDVVRALLEAKANPSEPFSDGRVAIEACARDTQVVLLLAKHGADVGVALSALALKGEAHLVRVLLTLPELPLTFSAHRLAACVNVLHLENVARPSVTSYAYAELVDMVRLVHDTQLRMARVQGDHFVRRAELAVPTPQLGRDLWLIVSAYATAWDSTPLPAMPPWPLGTERPPAPQSATNIDV